MQLHIAAYLFVRVESFILAKYWGSLSMMVAARLAGLHGGGCSAGPNNICTYCNAFQLTSASLYTDLLNRSLRSGAFECIG